jgi:uncharacterized repeat protein (TIGR01451 family)
MGNRLPGPLAPQAKEVIGITFRVTAPGEACMSVDVSAEGAELVTQRSCIKSSVKTVSTLLVEKVGPVELPVGATGKYLIEVTNTGNTPLTNVRIVDAYSTSVTPTSAPRGAVADGATIVWTIPELGPGVLVRRQVDCQALKPDANSVNTVRVTTDQRASGEKSVSTRIVAAGPGFAPPMRVPFDNQDAKDKGGEKPTQRMKPIEDEAEAEPGNVNADGELKLTLMPAAGSVKVGENLSYLLSVTNDRQVSDRQVKIRLTLPDGLQFVRFAGRYPATPIAPENRILDITPIAEMRAGETIDGLKLEVRALTPGKHMVQAEIQSQRAPAAATVSASATVLAK